MTTRFALPLLLLLLMPLAPAADARIETHWWEVGPALPRLTGRVVDEAELLPPAARARLERRLALFERRTRHQLVIVTVRSLSGQTIETFGVRLGRSWGIGRHDANDGVLLIVAPHERRVRIEVGYGLEKTLDDPTCSRIIAGTILPAFRQGDPARGIETGAAAIITRLSR
ncbi:TPM domain-containing protein [Flavisphingomonas formosensis]|uniref:TPM domain-containing protein n=1 Tax=Flavisphingomonas formosensis TaxID=861534 RepID=UPI001E5BF379|nr:TPM domain-containing protein [Sphingomonas formosensis]